MLTPEHVRRNEILLRDYGLFYFQIVCLLALRAIAVTTPGFAWALAAEIQRNAQDCPSSANQTLVTLERLGLVECRRDLGAPHWYRLTPWGWVKVQEIMGADEQRAAS